MLKLIKYLLVVIATLIVAAFIFFYFLYPKKTEKIDISAGRISRVTEMARLCAIDIYSEVPVLDTVNGKVIFAVQKQAGSISFDMDNLSIDDSGDTIRAILPREIIDLHEATEKNSWEVIDTKAIGPLALVRSDKFTLQEENLVKSRVRAKSIRLLYTNGTVRKAREEGARELRRLLELIYRKPVLITDPTPQGTP